MKKYTRTLIFLIFLAATSFKAFTQEKKVYTSLEEALANPSDVYWLNLSGRELTEFPEAILNLPNLELLDLSYNQLQEIPESIGKLISVKGWSLENNMLESIPAEIYEMENLRELNLANNNLKMLPNEIGEMALEHLSVQSNQLVDLPIFDEFLLVLLADDNKFTSFPVNILKAKSLNVLGFALNEIEILPLDLNQFKYLQILWLTEGTEDSNSELIKSLKKKKGKFKVELYTREGYSGERVLYGNSLNTMMFWN